MQLSKDHAKDAILNHLGIQHEYLPQFYRSHEAARHKQYQPFNYLLRRCALRMKHQSGVNKIGETLMHMP